MTKQRELNDWARVTLGKILARKCVQYFRNPEHRKQFEEWYLERYGVHYVWKKI